MQCLSGLVNGPYFILFSHVGLNFKVADFGAPGAYVPPMFGAVGVAGHAWTASSRAQGGGGAGNLAPPGWTEVSVRAGQ